MFVDASALLAVLLGETDAQRISRAMERAERLFISPVAIFETVAAIVRERAVSARLARQAVERALLIANVETVLVTREIGDLALETFGQYGKGRGHKAQLNMGDCFAYACAKWLGVPLLYKGDDFVNTDLA